MKLTLKDLKQLIKESVQNLLELEIVDDTITDYSNLNNVTAKLSAHFDEKTKTDLNREVARILRIGKSSLTHTKALQQEKSKEFI